MTVKELIEKLQTLPQDAQVVYQFCSSFCVLDAEQIGLIKAEEKKIINDGGMYYVEYHERWGPLNTEVFFERSSGWCPRSGWEFVTVVTFPGN